MIRNTIQFVVLAVLAGGAAAAQNYEVKEAAGEVVITTRSYEVGVSRNGLGYNVRKAGTTVLEMPALSPFPVSEGGKQRATKLRSWKLAGDKVTFEYDGARVELRPRDRSFQVTEWFYLPEPSVAPLLRWRLDSSGLWYGGGFQGLNEEHVLPLNKASFEAPSFLARGSTQGTPVWYSTNGVGVWIKTSNDFRYSVKEGLLTVQMPGASALNFDVIVEENGREVVRHILREIGYPYNTPPPDYIRMPIYTTWVEFKGAITQQKVLEFAKQIKRNNLPCGVIEIDMGWETKFGDLEVDLQRFPDMKAMTEELHQLGFRVTLWVANFVNADSKTFAAHRDDDMMCRDRSGNVGVIGWWAGYGGVWDFTNPRAAAEFRTRLKKLQALYGVDGFKFDSGEGNLVPRDLRCALPITPFEYADYYNREAVAHFPWNESRVGAYSQPTGIIQRLQDKQSSWSNRNGLGAMISQVFTVSLRGFFFVMPDIVGGNQYGAEPIDKELLIRWAQASALMPLIQFSKGPWHYDEETLRLVREASQLHIRFAPYISLLAERARSSGEPLIAPLWYHAPGDAQTLPITDQFMLGADVLVAPVLLKGALTRDIYLPAGSWLDLRTGAKVQGGNWIRGYPAPLGVLPVFTRVGFKALEETAE